MQKIEQLLRFLRCTLGPSAFCWDGTPQPLKDVEEKHCFFKPAQPYLTAKGLETAFGYMKPGCLYEAADSLGVHFFFFLFEGKPIWAGPFVTEEWSASAVREKERLAGAGLPASRLLPYQVYYCSQCFVDGNMSRRIAAGAVAALLPDAPPYAYQMFSAPVCHSLPDTQSTASFNFESASQQFELEKGFYRLVQEGRTEAALEVWERMEKLPLAEEMAPFDLYRKIASLTGLRFLLRMIAEYSGVHPAAVYAASVAYGQKIYAARSSEELHPITRAMIREFSDAVHDAHASRYTPAVHTAVNYLKQHLSRKIEPRQLAALAGCTPDHLRQRFKAETGLTISQYQARARCLSAAELLRLTDLPVHKISAHVGYMDSNYFVKVFKKYTGDTPTEYRARLQL